MAHGQKDGAGRNQLAKVNAKSGTRRRKPKRRPVSDRVSHAKENDEILSKEKTSCVRFDTESGTILYLEESVCAPDFEIECTHCGTLIGFDAEFCPICGAKFEMCDTGIVKIFVGMDFETERDAEIDCPLCGERITPEKGICPFCKERVHDDNPQDSDIKLEPVIHNENVVFMHFDVETGEVSFLQRLARCLGFEQLTVKLDKVTGGDSERKAGRSLSRT